MQTATPPGRRDRKKQQTKAALATAALRLVDERGLDRVTVEEISEAADVSVRTFFNYFATKDDALIGDPMMEDEEVRAGLLSAPAGSSCLAAVRHAFGPVVERIQADRETWLMRMRVIKHNPALLPALLAKAQQAEEELVRDLAERLGVAPEERYPQLVASLTGAAFRTAMMRWATLGDGRLSLADELDHACEVLVTGLIDPTPNGSSTEEKQ